MNGGEPQDQPEPQDRRTADFVRALKPDVVIEGVERPGALSATEVLATRSWFDRQRAGD